MIPKYCLFNRGKEISEDKWEVYTENGRENKFGHSEVAFEAVDRGAGEVILTSIDKDGTKKGFDLSCLKKL